MHTSLPPIVYKSPVAIALQPSPPPLFTRWLNIISAAPPGSPTICGGLSLGKALIIRYRLAVWLLLGAASASARACGLLCTTQKSHAAGRPHSQLPFCFCFCSLRIALPCLALLAIVPESSPPPSSPLKEKTGREEGEIGRNRRIELRQEETRSPYRTYGLRVRIALPQARAQ